MKQAKFRNEFLWKRQKILRKMTFNGCPHLEALKSEKGTKSYYILHACFISCKSADDRRRKVKNESNFSLLHQFKQSLIAFSYDEHAPKYDAHPSNNIHPLFFIFLSYTIKQIIALKSPFKKPHLEHIECL